MAERKDASKEPAFKLDEKLIKDLHENTSQRIIAVTEDKVRLWLHALRGVFHWTRDWKTSGGFAATFCTTMFAAEFKPFLGLPKEMVIACFGILSIASSAWFIFAIVQCVRFRGESSDEALISRLRNQ